jgi:photosystem II stability/assembly factor-like uncharacterized protein
MKAGNVTAARWLTGIALGVICLTAGSPVVAETPDAACMADSLYLISPDEIDLQLQTDGRSGLTLSWPDLDLAQSTCFVLDVTDDAGFDAEVTGGYGGLVDRYFQFTTESEGTVGAAQADRLIYGWSSDGPSYFGSAAGTLNLANNGGLWRYNQAAGTWGQLNQGFPMTWPQTNCVAFAESENGAMLASISTGSNVGTSPKGLWLFSGGSWSRLAEDLFDEYNLVTEVAFAPGSGSVFAVGTSANGLYLTTDSGATFTQWTTEFDPTFDPQPTVVKVQALNWTDNRLMVFIPNFGLFISEDGGTNFSRSEFEVFKDLDRLRTARSDGGLFGGEALRMRGTLEMDMTGTDALVDYTRELTLPIVLEIHTAPRTLGDPVQDFAIQLMTLDGRIEKDSDFETFFISAGDSAGLPSPGNLTVTLQPDGKYRVEGYLDIDFEIEMEGALGGPFSGYSGTTAGTTRFVLGDESLGEICLVADNGSGTIDLPPQCAEGFLGHLQLSTGLPAGSTLEIDAHLGGYQEAMVLPLANQIVEHPTNSDHLLAALSFHGVWESDDGGYTWHDLYGNLNVVDDEVTGRWVRDGVSVAIDSADEQVIVVALRQEGIYRTIDGGLTWQEVSGTNDRGTVQPPNLGSLTSMEVRADETQSGRFYVQEDKWSLLMSDDFGANWDHFADLPVLNKSQVLEMAADGSGDLIYGSYGGGIYIPGSPLALSDTYNSDTTPYLRDSLDLGLSISFSEGPVTAQDSLYLRCQTYQGWAVWRTSGVDPADLTLIGLFDRVNPEACIEGYCGDDSYDLKPQCFISKRAACFDFSTPDTIRFFDDEVYNGFDYYYGISSFDYGSTALTTPTNSSQTMLFSPRYPDDPNSPFAGDGNLEGFRVNMVAAPAITDQEIYVFPNPLRLGEGIRDFEGKKVVFTNLPAESRIQIFTTAGDLVIDLGPDLQEGGNIPWNTRNSEGEELAAGVFLYKVTMVEREEFWGKVVIIR